MHQLVYRSVKSLLILVIFLLSVSVSHAFELPAKEWIQLIDRGDLTGIQQQVERGASLKLNSKGLNLPLRRAVMEEQVAILRYLLQQGAEIEKTLPLWDFSRIGYDNILILKAGHTEITRLLLEAGADPNLMAGGANADTDMAPLQYAVMSHNLETVRLMLAYGADPQGTGSDSSRPILLAIGAKSPEMITLLIQYGVDVNWLASQGSDYSVAEACQRQQFRAYETPLNLVLRYPVNPTQQQMLYILRQAGGLTFEEWCRQK